MKTLVAFFLNLVEYRLKSELRQKKKFRYRCSGATFNKMLNLTLEYYIYKCRKLWYNITLQNFESVDKTNWNNPR